MKHIVTILLILATYFSQATTYIVSNVPGFPANFSNLQACVNAASNGDIIIVQGSGTSYGDIDVNKQLTILGPGYFLNQNPQTQAVLASAKLNSIYFKNGSGGSILEGMDIISNRPISITTNCIGATTYSIRVDSSNITCISNHFETNWILLTNSDGSLIKNNFGLGVIATQSISNLMVSNNIFQAGGDFNSAVVSNNFFDYDLSSDSYGFFSCNVVNNIFGYGFNGCLSNSIFNNNVCTLNPFGSNIGTNLVNIDPNSLFVGYPSQGGYSNDGKYRLKNNSPAIGAGEGGIDVGPFGGSSPYRLSGISLHPNIWFVNMPIIGTSGGGLQVQVKVNAND